MQMTTRRSASGPNGSAAHAKAPLLCLALAGFAGFAGFAVSGAAGAEDPGYRPGYPAVLSAPPVIAPAAGARRDRIASNFQSAYAAAGSPAIVLLWNRRMSDQVRRQRVDMQATRIDGSTQERAAPGLRQSSTHLDAVSVSGQVELGDGPTQAAVSPADEVAVRSRLTQRLRDAGAVFVDRNLALRQQALDTSEDYQSMEMRALAARASWLVEVDVEPDAASPLGLIFNASIKDLKAARLLAEISTTAIPEHEPVATPGFRAVPGEGFRRAPAPPSPPPDASAIGDELALQLMEQMVAGLRE